MQPRAGLLRSNPYVTEQDLLSGKCPQDSDLYRYGFKGNCINIIITTMKLTHNKVAFLVFTLIEESNMEKGNMVASQARALLFNNCYGYRPCELSWFPEKPAGVWQTRTQFAGRSSKASHMDYLLTYASMCYPFQPITFQNLRRKLGPQSPAFWKEFLPFSKEAQKIYNGLSTIGGHWNKFQTS